MKCGRHVYVSNQCREKHTRPFAFSCLLGERPSPAPEAFIAITNVEQILRKIESAVCDAQQNQIESKPAIEAEVVESESVGA